MNILESSYLKLSETLYKLNPPENFDQVDLLLANPRLKELGDPADLISYFHENAQALSLVYAGHQFGHFNPQLGDGRAHLLGEVKLNTGLIKELQFKGSGQTFFSRGGDGRSPLGAALREFLVSEYLYKCGIPTTRSLAVYKTTEQLQRNSLHPGGIIARLATAHIRVGSLEFFTVRNDSKSLQELVDLVIKQAYPGVQNTLELFENILDAQAKLIAKWMGVGFIHGVMNTDNMSLAGETIDYGPCAFMNYFDKDKVYSSIDRYGRYAYKNQPVIAQWNLSVLAACLLHLKEAPESEFTRVLNTWDDRYHSYLHDEFAQKLGFDSPDKFPKSLCDQWLDLLAREKLDFTNAHVELTKCLDSSPTSFFGSSEKFKKFYNQWKNQLEQQEVELTFQIMSKKNPRFIPRNHILDQALRNAEQGDMRLFNEIYSGMDFIFQDKQEYNFLTIPPLPGEDIEATFCGT